MDADIIASELIEKLENMLSNEPKIIDSRLGNEIQMAINNLQLLKQSVKHGGDSQQEASSEHSINHQSMARLLLVLSYVEDATDYLSEALEQRRNVGSIHDKIFQWFMCFKSPHWQASSNCEMKKFKNEVRSLSSDDFLEEVRKADASNTQEVGDDNNVTRMRFQIDNGGWERISDFYLEERTDIVGLEEQMEDLVARLIPDKHNHNVDQSRDVPTEVPDEENRDRSRDHIATEESFNQSPQVIAMVGEGGSGKTTLVQSVYNRLKVKQHFNKRAWVNASSVFQARHVLADILKQIDEHVFAVEPTLSEEELISKITGVLYGADKRRPFYEVDEARKPSYLIVLENFQRHEVWEALIRALSSSSLGLGRIIMTSAGDYYNVEADATYSTHRLNNEESWKLFSKKTRIADDDLNNSELNTCKKRILNICGGLPLALVLLGGLLSTKERSCQEWSRVIDRASNIGDIMALSYENLPSQVKPCFLYMGLFPREFEIPVRRLRHLWFAEGFLTPLDHEVTGPEDLADIYFQELLTRSMIQMRWRSDGSPKRCRVPGGVHDFFHQKAVEEGFFHHELGSSHSAEQPQLGIQRVAPYLSIKDFPSSFLHSRYLRSCVDFDTRIRVTPAREICTLLEKIIFRLLRVLDLEDVYKPLLPDAIGKLLRLRYLGLRSTFLDALPSSMDLPCLEVLDIKHTKIQKLPASLSEATKMQHLYLNWFPCTAELRSESLTNLHTLWGLDIDINNEKDFASLRKNLVKFRKLGLTCSSTSVLEAIAEC